MKLEVKYWISFNEISMHAWCGVTMFEGQPRHSPETQEYSIPKRKVPYVAAHNMLLAHGKAYRMYEKEFRKTQNGKFGIVVGGRWCKTFSSSPEDIAAAQRALDWSFNWTVAPIFGEKGDYPEHMKKEIQMLEKAENQEIMPRFTEQEITMLKGSADFCGINYYLTNEVLAGDGPSQMEKDAHFDYLDGRWEKISGKNSWLRYVPEGLLELLEYIRDNYGNIPVLITENGCDDSSEEKVDVLCDQHRIRYIKGHIETVRKALQRGCNVIGYTVWSLMDNFEWDAGFAMKFGLYRVDFDSPSKTRRIKNSGIFFKNFLSQMRKDVESKKQ
ncbi:glycosyl hydrolase, family 1 [Necator americanus]|uniref:Glycosyl hydrolase, family 1 n=1 Tax=Necator americanus TaxID=51031 RepID=W2T4J9_NECAM|nr:glycosyl hydrolase, family 1 [Necator americanus]ETN76955.1 glycosyl hydrolase, family 1 [Necator americanus]